MSAELEAEVARLRERVAVATALVEALLAEYRRADYHWTLEFQPVPARWEDWVPKSPVIAKASAFLGRDAAKHPADCEVYALEKVLGMSACGSAL